MEPAHRGHLGLGWQGLGTQGPWGGERGTPVSCPMSQAISSRIGKRTQESWLPAPQLASTPKAGNRIRDP